MSKTMTYTLVTVVVFFMFAIGMFLLAPYMGVHENIVTSAVICSFYVLTNVMSFNMHNFVKQRNDTLLTPFLLIDKTVRFIASIALIGMLLYITKESSIGIIGFVGYVIAMVIEILYFVNTYKKPEVKNV